MAVIRGRESGTRFKGYIEGGPAAAVALANLAKSVRDELLVEATQVGAEVIADEWRQRAMGTFGLGPGTAHYVDAIEVKARPGKKGATASIGLGQVQTEEGEAQPAEYFAPLEFGASNKPARPTARPAFDASKGRAVDAMGKKVVELIERGT